MSENHVAEIQIAFVRVCRNSTNAKSVWVSMNKIFPEFTTDQIRQAVQPVLKSMVEAARD